MSLRDKVKHSLLNDMIMHVKEKTKGWSVLVLDDYTTRLLSSATSMSTLIDSGISCVEKLELKRQRFDMDVIYFISSKNVQKVLDDFQNVAGCLYRKVHLFFHDQATDDVMERIKSNSILLQRIETFKEVNIDFLAHDENIFNLGVESRDMKKSLGMASSFQQLYSSRLEHNRHDTCKRIAKQMVSVLATLREYPFVRYTKESSQASTIAKNIQDGMNEYVSKCTSFAHEANRATLIIVDRCQDLATPLMHECTYQSMLYDLMPFKSDDCVEYTTQTMNGEVKKLALLNENDSLWRTYRFQHVAQVSDQLSAKMKELSTSNTGAISKQSNTPKTMEQIASAMRELPEYQQILGKVSQHLTLVGMAMDEFIKRDLMNVAKLEQNIALGTNENGKKVTYSTLLRETESMMESKLLNELDKVRLVAIFLLCEGGLSNADRKSLFAKADISMQYQTALLNLNQLGSRSTTKPVVVSKKLDGAILESRYRPKLTETITQASRSTLNESDFPFVIRPPPEKSTPTSVAAAKDAKPISMRKRGNSGASSIHRRTKSSDSYGAAQGRIILLLLGGVSYSEIKAWDHVRNEKNQDIILGCTEYLTPEEFVQQMTDTQ